MSDIARCQLQDDAWINRYVVKNNPADTSKEQLSIVTIFDKFSWGTPF